MEDLRNVTYRMATGMSLQLLETFLSSIARGNAAYINCDMFTHEWESVDGL